MPFKRISYNSNTYLLLDIHENSYNIFFQGFVKTYVHILKNPDFKTKELINNCFENKTGYIISGGTFSNDTLYTTFTFRNVCNKEIHFEKSFNFNEINIQILYECNKENQCEKFSQKQNNLINEVDSLYLKQQNLSNTTNYTSENLIEIFNEIKDNLSTQSHDNYIKLRQEIMDKSGTLNKMIEGNFCTLRGKFYIQEHKINKVEETNNTLIKKIDDLTERFNILLKYSQDKFEKYEKLIEKLTENKEYRNISDFDNYA